MGKVVFGNTDAYKTFEEYILTDTVDVLIKQVARYLRLHKYEVKCINSEIIWNNTRVFYIENGLVYNVTYAMNLGTAETKFIESMTHSIYVVQSELNGYLSLIKKKQ